MASASDSTVTSRRRFLWSAPAAAVATHKVMKPDLDHVLATAIAAYRRTSADHDEKDTLDTFNAYREACGNLIRTPAQTFEGAAQKAAIVVGIYGGDGDIADEIDNGGATLDVNVAFSVIRDLVRLSA